MLALISKTPLDILKIYSENVIRLNIPSLWQQDGATSGWVSPDGAYALVSVVQFVPPVGQIVIGQASYSFDNNQNVIETYATVQTPVATLLSSLEFRNLFTQSEKLAVTGATLVNAQLREFVDDADAAGNVDLTNPEVIQGINSLVAANLITQIRADQILAGIPPS